MVHNEIESVSDPATLTGFCTCGSIMAAPAPMLAPNEMANKSRADVVTKIKASAYAAQYRANIDTQAPFDGKVRGGKPAMSDQDVEDLETFLKTLSDADVKGL